MRVCVLPHCQRLSQLSQLLMDSETELATLNDTLLCCVSGKRAHLHDSTTHIHSLHTAVCQQYVGADTGAVLMCMASVSISHCRYDLFRAG